MGSPNDAAEPGPAEPPSIAAGSDTFCLRWKNHSQHLLDVFGQLYQDEALVDVTLAAEGRSLRAHKMVLSACSPFFRDLFAAHSESHPIVILKDTTYTELQTLLDFMYKGEVNIDQENLDTLLKTAEDLRIRGLADVVGQWREKARPASVPVQTLEHTESDIKSESESTTPNELPSVPNEQRDCLAYYPRHKHAKRKHETRDYSEDLYGRQAELAMRTASPELEGEEHAPHNDIKMEVSPSLDREEAQDLSSRPSVSQSSSPPSVNYHGGVIAHKFHWPTVTDSEESEGELEEQVGASGIPYTQPPYDGIVKVSPDLSGQSRDERLPSAEVVIQEEDFPTRGQSDRHANEDTSPQGPDSSPNRGSNKIVPFYRGRYNPFTDGPIFPGLRPGIRPSPNHQGGMTHRPVMPFTGQPGDFPFFPMPFDFGLRFGYPFLPHMPERPPTSEASGPGGGSSPKSNTDGGAGQSSRGAPPLGLKGVTDANRDIAQALIESHLGQGYSLGSREKPYKCDQCGQCYKYLSAFSKHKEQNHTARLPGEKPFRCEVCGMQFKYLKSFKKHRLNHAVERLQQPFPRPPGEERSLLDMLGKSPSEQPPMDQPIPLLANSASSTPTQITLPTGAQPLPLNSAQSLPCSESAASASPDKKCEDTAEDLTQSKLDVQSSPAPGPSRSAEQDSASLEQQSCICPSCRGRFYNEESLRIHSVSCRSQSEERRFVHQPSGSMDPGFYEMVRRQALFAAKAAMDSKVPVSPSAGQDSSVKPGVAPSPSSASSGAAANAMMKHNDSSPEETMDVSDRETSDIDNEDQLSDTKCFHRSLNFPPTSFNFQPGPPGASHLQLSVYGHPPYGTLPPDFDPGRPHICPFCGKGFRAKENLKLHIRKHTGERPFQCGYCHRAFGGKSDMNRHVRIHTGERPYRCDACGKTFARADYLSKHLSTHLA